MGRFTSGWFGCRGGGRQRGWPVKNGNTPGKTNGMNILYTNARFLYTARGIGLDMHPGLFFGLVFTMFISQWSILARFLQCSLPGKLAWTVCTEVVFWLCRGCQGEEVRGSRAFQEMVRRCVNRADTTIDLAEDVLGRLRYVYMNIKGSRPVMFSLLNTFPRLITRTTQTRATRTITQSTKRRIISEVTTPAKRPAPPAIIYRDIGYRNVRYRSASSLQQQQESHSGL